MFIGIGPLLRTIDLLHRQPARTHERKRPVMSTTLTVASRPLAVLHTTRLNVPSLIQLAQAVLTGMTGNPVLPTPTPALTVLSAALGDLTNAENAALTRARGAVATRNEKRAILTSVLELLRGYVQGVADANPSTAAAIIEGAAMAVRRTPSRTPRVFSIRQGAVSGTAIIRTGSAGSGTSYEWQYSINGGQTWVAAPPTIQARMTLSGLAPLTTLEVKYRAVTRRGPTDWSQPLLFPVT
jgi:hypothetical protein